MSRKSIVAKVAVQQWFNGSFQSRLVPELRRTPSLVGAKVAVQEWWDGSVHLFHQRTGEIAGPMLVQTVYENDSIVSYDSPVYSVLNLRLSKELGVFRLSAGVNNIWDYHQPPLSHHGRTEYYWGPIIGRELYATVAINI